MAALEANGMVVEVKSLLPEGTTLWAYFKGAAGPRVELVSRAMEPFIAHWFATADTEV
jgi:lactoylglutathione lyase